MNAAIGSQSSLTETGWNFQKLTVVIALVVLSGALIVLGTMLYSSRKNSKFPVDVPACPDGWNVSESMKDQCYRTTDKKRNIANDTNGVYEYDNNGKEYLNFYKILSPDVLLDKCKFAKTNGIAWDGVTNTGVC